MQRRAFLATALATAALMGTGAWAAVDEASYVPLDKMVDEAMAAYNAKNSKQFYANFSAGLKQLQTDLAFQTMYVQNYLATYGAFKSKTNVKEKSVVSSGNALLVYNAVFSKKPGQLSVNFIKEGSAFKIMQIRIDPVK